MNQADNKARTERLARRRRALTRKNICFAQFDGLIGAGKSTLIEMLLSLFSSMENIKVVYVAEPLKRWVFDELFGDYCAALGQLAELQKYRAYLSSMRTESCDSEEERSSNSGSPKGSSVFGAPEPPSDCMGIPALFQAYTLATRCNVFIDGMEDARELADANPDCLVLVISERSWWTDKAVFASMLFESELVVARHRPYYDKTFENWLELVGNFVPDMCVLVDTTLEDAMERVHKRARDGESVVTEDYQKALWEKHQEVFGPSVRDFMGAPIMRVDGAQPFNRCLDTVGRIADEFMQIARACRA